MHGSNQVVDSHIAECRSEDWSAPVVRGDQLLRYHYFDAVVDGVPVELRHYQKKHGPDWIDVVPEVA